MAEFQFDPRVERSPTGPGKVESDDFIINDVTLRISPTNIEVFKESFNNEWETLRTASARKVKSGYGISRVVINQIFKVSDPTDSDNLSRLVAGLRATPFCVVYSPYLDKTLGRPDSESPIVSGNDPIERRPFQPIMLCMSSMVFSTMGHQGMPDCIQATFDFLWFNYLPFTNYIAFKTGPGFNKPGFPHQSELWKAFYEPFYNSQIPIKFPHSENDANRATRFMWREFLLLAQGSSLATAAAKDLVDTIQNKPTEIQDILSEIVNRGTLTSEWERADMKNPDSITSGVLDTLYRRAVQKGVINPSDDVRKQLANIPKGAITQAGESLIAPIIRKLYSDDKALSRAKDSASVASAILAERIKKQKSIESKKDLLVNQDVAGGYTELINAESKYGNKSAGGLKLLGRKRALNIVHRPTDDPNVTPAIIQQITVTFRNTLATIPLLAYRYPTIQHIGSIDADVGIVINAKNSAARDIRAMYDSVETMAVRYRQVPAGFRNIHITNDFLALFGLEEFITSGLGINSIDGQPGRSFINLTLVDAGITSKTRDPEQITQEFVQNDQSISKEIWTRFLKNMTEQREQPANKGLGVLSFFSKQRNNTQPPIARDYYKMRLTGVRLAGNDSTYSKLVNEAVEAYNEFIDSVHGQVFGLNPIEGSNNYAAIMSVEENSSFFGYVPGIDRVKRSLQLRNKAFRDADQHKRVRSANFQSNKQLEQQARANQIVSNYTGNAGVNTKVQSKIQQKKLIRLTNMGINIYLNKMNALFTKVNQTQLGLDQFTHLLERKDNLGLDNGLMAYSDFRPQLSSVAKLVEGSKQQSDSSLTKYDPDCYFYYPIHDGAAASPLTGIVDPYTISQAKAHSLSVWDTANENLKKFFKDVYHERLNSDLNPRPAEVLRNLGGLELQTGLYTESNIKNSTQSESIKKSVVVDPVSKSPTNWYPQKEPPIQSDQICDHSTDLRQLWDGVGIASGGASLPSNGFTSAFTPASSFGGNTKKLPRKSPYLAGLNEYKHLDELRIEVQPVFERILDDLTSQGFRPKISNAYRTPAQQREKVLRGWAQKSAQKIAAKAIKDGRFPPWMSIKDVVRRLIDTGEIVVKVGYHNWGLAADIIPKGWGWKKVTPDVAKFFLALRRSAQKNGLVSGGAWSRSNPIWAKYDLGWDPAHIQVSRWNGQRLPREWRQDIMKQRARKIDSAQKNISPGPTQKRIEQLKNQPIARDVTSSLTSPLGQAINEFERDIYNGQAQSMMRAYPAFKLYFIEDDSEERKRFQFDDFFSYQSVQSIRVIRSRKIPADLCEIYLTNISGVLSNRKFRNSKKNDRPFTAKGFVAEESQSAGKGGTREENPIASLLLQEGIHIHLKLGYVNDPSRLEDTFNGVITEVQFSDSDDLVRILCQSYAIELSQDIKGVEKPISKSSNSLFGWNFWGFFSEATTGRILEEMLAEPEVLHFGRWSPTAEGANPARDLLTQRWTFNPQPSDDNIFAPNPSQDLGLLGDGLFFKNLKYVIYRTTIWDIFQEMTLRHPNFIALPVPYKGVASQRMTMFFGLPNQLYFFRDPDSEEQQKDERLKREQKEAEARVLRDRAKQLAKLKILEKASKATKKIPYALSVINPTAPIAGLVTDYLLKRNKQSQKEETAEDKVTKATSNYYREQRLRLAKSSGYVKPFRNYHLVTSSQHIISNSIRANSRDVANTIVIKYGKIETPTDASGFELADAALKGDEQEFTLKLDNALPTEDMRTQMGQFINVTNEDLAKRYALSLLLRNIKDTYKGELVIVGNPKMKPHDLITLYDEYSSLTGMIEIEEVQHIFDQTHGFRTEIKPDMFAQASELSLLSSAEALGIIMEGSLRKLGLYDSSLSKFFAPNPYSLGRSIGFFGGFLAQKLINYTQLSQPVIMCPLLHNGKIMCGGLSARKIPTSWWSTEFAKWSSQYDQGYSDWIEDVKDQTRGWINKTTGRFAVGSFFNSGDDVGGA